jgi:hypothetical protein
MLGVRVVTDHHRRVRVQHVGIREPGVHDPFDQFLVRALHLGGQRDAHALHQRTTRHMRARVQPPARHPRCHRLQRPQLVVRDTAVRPTPSGRRPHRQPYVSLPRPLHRGLEHPRQHQRVVECIVWPQLRDAPMRGQGFQPQVLGAQRQASGQLDRAHHGVDRQLGLGHLGLGGQKSMVERHVVGHQRAAFEHVQQVVGDVGEGRLVGQHSSGKPVHVRRARVDTRIQEADHRAVDGPAGVERQRGQADHPRMARAEARGLDIQDHPARIVLGDRPAPRRLRQLRWRCHTPQNGTQPRQNR